MGNIETRDESRVGVYGIEEDGTDTWVFWVLHILAMVCLISSMIVSTGVLVYLFKTNTQKNIFKRPIGERLVVYLAISDLFYSVSHTLDHTYMIAVVGNPPLGACRTFAFFLQMFIMVQSIIVLFTALNAFLMVVVEKKVSLGKNDWKLLLVSLGIPALIGFVGVSVPFLGPSGPWCLVDMGYSWGPAINNVYGVTMALVFAVNLGSYGLIWVKITQASKKSGGDAKYHRTARVMMLFVVVYLIQWWPYVVQALWSFFEPPHVSIYIIAVFTCNTGGIFNFIAYTLIRKKYQKVEPAGKKDNVVAVDNKKTVSSGVSS